MSILNPFRTNPMDFLNNVKQIDTSPSRTRTRSQDYKKQRSVAEWIYILDKSGILIGKLGRKHNIITTDGKTGVISDGRQVRLAIQRTPGGTVNQIWVYQP
jgi:hypothetical protein